MKQLIACCGLDCESCDARIATVKNDDELREKTAQKWSAMNNAPEITAATINCMGCRTDGMKFAYCSDYCEIRKCVSGKGFNTCGDCDELDSCQIVGAVLQHAPGAREDEPLTYPILIPYRQPFPKPFRDQSPEKDKDSVFPIDDRPSLFPVYSVSDTQGGVLGRHQHRIIPAVFQ